MKKFFVLSAIINPRVVFPVPGGPYKIRGGIFLESITRRNSLCSPKICSWPTKFSKLAGLTRAGKGENSLSILTKIKIPAFGPSQVCRFQSSPHTGGRRILLPQQQEM